MSCECYWFTGTKTHTDTLIHTLHWHTTHRNTGNVINFVRRDVLLPRNSTKPKHMCLQEKHNKTQQIETQEKQQPKRNSSSFYLSFNWSKERKCDFCSFVTLTAQEDIKTQRKTERSWWYKSCLCDAHVESQPPLRAVPRWLQMAQWAGGRAAAWAATKIHLGCLEKIPPYWCRAAWLCSVFLV